MWIKCIDCNDESIRTRKSKSKRCWNCYNKWRTGRRIISVEDRFWKYVKKTDSCWTWTGYCDKYGYGTLNDFGKMKKAHRVSYELHNGQIPNGKWVCHSCDNPPCVNPNHLWLGDAVENVIDMVKKGRAAKNMGEAHGASKLSTSDILEIRNLKHSGLSSRKISLKFNIHKSYVGLIVRRERWSHIP